MERVAGDLARRNEIDNELVDLDLCTTTFVIREFLRTIVCDLEYIHAGVLAVGPEPGGAFSFQKLHEWLAEPSQANFSRRAFQRLNRVVAAIHREFPRGVGADHDIVLEFLQELAEIWLRDLVRMGLRRLRILTELDAHAGELAQWIETNRPFPSSPPFPSQASTVLAGRADDVDRVLAALEVEKSALVDRNLRKALRQYRSGKVTAFDFSRLKQRQSGDWRLGDLLIALEAPEGSQIYTCDHHFDLLCRVLGTTRFTGVASRRKRTRFRPGGS